MLKFPEFAAIPRMAEQGQAGPRWCFTTYLMTHSMAQSHPPGISSGVAGIWGQSCPIKCGRVDAVMRPG